MRSSDQKFIALIDLLRATDNKHEPVFTVRHGTMVVWTRRAPLPGAVNADLANFCSASLADGLEACLDKLIGQLKK